MNRQELVDKLTERVGKPVHISSVISGQRVGGDGVLKDILIDSDQNGPIKVEFTDGRMFGIQPDSDFKFEKVSKSDAEKAEGSGLNVDEGDGEETDEAKSEREAREKGEVVSARKTKRAAELTEASSDDTEDESEDEASVEAPPKVKKAKKTARSRK